MRVGDVSHKGLETNEGRVVVILLARYFVLWNDLIAHLLQHLVNMLLGHLVAERYQAAAPHSLDMQ